VTRRYVTSRPASTQPATVPAAPKSMSSGCAATTRTRSTSVSGVAEGGKLTSLCSEPAAPGPQDEQCQLGTVGAQRLPETVQDLALAGEHQPGASAGYAGRADLLRDRGPLLPEPDD